MPEPAPLSAKEADKRARKARRKSGPEVYKGSLAQKRRIIIDAPEAENEVDTEDGPDSVSASAEDKRNSSAKKRK
ncbi:hypothetical protein GCM10023185_24650 [Hymenobacter saemangeumensis]|uniref:Uncharacterized protein n=2 Tax=Hymenobacter saemangeumensis TaxID=1084522 RepID=A0ABP8IH19_9BACT